MNATHTKMLRDFVSALSGIGLSVNDNDECFCPGQLDSVHGKNFHTLCYRTIVNELLKLGFDHKEIRGFMYIKGETSGSGLVNGMWEPDFICLSVKRLIKNIEERMGKREVFMGEGI